MPFDEDNNLLLPATTCELELWPMLLSKAIIKLANVEYVESGISTHLYKNKKANHSKNNSTTSIFHSFIVLINF